MSQRNPMNERYTRESNQGKTRKSAAAMKPKSKAASTVHVQPKEKTKQQKKTEKQATRQRQTELDRKYYNPPTAEYKRLKRIWWALLAGALVFTALSFLGRGVFQFPETVLYVILGLAYACIIGALYVDFGKVRKVRRKYQAEMEAKKPKEVRAAEKQEKATKKSDKEEAAEKYEQAKAAEAAKQKKGLFGRVKAKAATTDEADSQDASAKDDN